MRGVLVLKLTAVDKREINQYDVDRKTNASFSDGNPIPNLNSLTNLLKDFCKIPDCTEKDIYNYLVIKMNIKSQLKSKNFQEDKNVIL